jgi:alpha-galactosidase
MTIVDVDRISFSKENLLVIETANTALILGENHQLYQLYYGAKLSDLDGFLQEEFGQLLAYSTHKAWEKFAALEVRHGDGQFGLELEVVSTSQLAEDDNVTLTTIELRDTLYDFTVKLVYKAYYKEDVITCHTVISHREDSPVRLYNYASGELSFNYRFKEYHLTSFTSEWADEAIMHEEELQQGTKRLENRTVNRSAFEMNPSFLLHLGGLATETTGEVIGAALAWSGSWKIDFIRSMFSSLRVQAGVHPVNAEYVLDAGIEFETPLFIFTYSKRGKGQVSRNLHHWSRLYQMPHPERLRPILLNSWEGAYFTFDEEKLVSMMDGVKTLGAEMFVLDDGWFGNEFPRNNSLKGLGDWQVNRLKLPNGLNFLVEKAHEKGLEFGIWLEPEMVNPESELYRSHPDWVVAMPGRDRALARTQLCLDLTNPEVQNFMFHAIDDLLVAHPQISYVKWDCNRDVTNEGSSYLAADRQTNLVYDYIAGLYRVFKRLTVAHPNLMLKSCASGGGRMDFGTLQYCDEFWTSDNTDALQRIYIQWSTGQIYPAHAMGAHVTASPNPQTKRPTPLKFRFDVAMSGRLGFELDPEIMSEDEIEFSQKAVELYKQIREIIQQGALYRLVSPFKENYASLMYLSEDGSVGVWFAYNTHHKVHNLFDAIRLQGLEEDAYYRIREVNVAERLHLSKSTLEFSGSYLMNHGLRVDLNGLFESAMFMIEKL